VNTERVTVDNDFRHDFDFAEIQVSARILFEVAA
jgi:hypothetical protein